jgi:hypothetical protein
MYPFSDSRESVKASVSFDDSSNPFREVSPRRPTRVETYNRRRYSRSHRPSPSFFMGFSR